jgi:uncharacterized membrane protein (DUF2068 family)
MKARDTKLIRMIAVFKLLKAALLIAVGLGALRLIQSDATNLLEHWMRVFGLVPGSRYIVRVLQSAIELTPNRFKVVGIVSFVYSGLFLLEGIGLWLLKRWAEWFTVIMTSSLIPVEMYEILRHPSEIKVLVLIFNIAVVGFLLYQIRDVQGESRSGP